MIRLVTFDCYGTLIDWAGGLDGAIRGLLRKKGVRNAPPDLAGRYVRYEFLVERDGYKLYREVLCLSLAKFLKEDFSIALSEEEARTLVRGLPEWKPFPEADRVLGELKKAYKLAVLSNVDNDLIQSSLKKIKVPFDAVITAEDVGSYKPVTNHWKRALELFGLEPDGVFHVGASPLHDVLPAKQLGIPCAWINRNGEPGDSFTLPDHVFPDLEGLLGVLR